LNNINIKADFIPSKATTATLAEELLSIKDFRGATVVRVRGNLADDRVEKILTDGGADTIPLQVYQTYYPEWLIEFKNKLFERPPHIITFTSGSTVQGLNSILNREEIKEITKDKVVVSIGPSTTEIIQSSGIEVTIEADEHSVPGMIKKIVEYYNKGGNNG
jgi:uroporphyrinogen-III synthase